MITSLIMLCACGSEPQARVCAAQVKAAEALGEETTDGVLEREVTLAPQVSQRLSASYRALSQTALENALVEPGVELPQAHHYGLIKVRDDWEEHFIVDGYRQYAVIPFDDDGAAPYRFFVLRQGGVTGQQWVAGPYRFNVAVVTVR